MISEELWKYMYNSVFAIYLPPDSLIDKVVLNNNGVKKEFDTMSELISFLTIGCDKEIVQKDVKFYLRDNSLFEENTKFYNKLCRILKKVV